MSTLNLTGNHLKDQSIFIEHLKPFRDNFAKITIPHYKICKIHQFVDELINVKRNENRYKYDLLQLRKRYITGLTGEAALEELLGIHNIIDWTIGESDYYNVPDLKGIGVNVGVKTSECYNFPVIKKDNNYSQIINIKMNNHVVYVCGLGTPEVLNKYQSYGLIKDKSILNYNKTGFWGFENLVSLKDIGSREELNSLLNSLVDVRCCS